MTRPDIRVISRDNGVGLSRDLQLVAGVLRDTGRAVETVAYGALPILAASVPLAARQSRISSSVVYLPVPTNNRLRTV